MENNNMSFKNSYDYGNLSPDDLKKIQQVESQLNQGRQNKLVLIAFENKK